MKRRIRLTESQLHNVIRRCVNEALEELDARTYANYARGREAQGNAERPLSQAKQRVGDFNAEDAMHQGQDAALNAWNKKFR